jgi:hypothetical protein
MKLRTAAGGRLRPLWNEIGLAHRPNLNNL